MQDFLWMPPLAPPTRGRPDSPERKDSRFSASGWRDERSPRPMGRFDDWSRPGTGLERSGGYPDDWNDWSAGRGYDWSAGGYDRGYDWSGGWNDWGYDRSSGGYDWA